MTVRIPKVVGVLVVLVLAAGLVVGGYFLGYSSADRDGQRAKGRAAGLKIGTAKGYEDGRADGGALYEEGTPGYEGIYQKGHRAGRKKGHAEGVAEGEESGYAAGNETAFAGFDGGWEIGGWYLVHFGQPPAGDRYFIESRIRMETGETYHMCPYDADEICGGEF